MTKKEFEYFKQFTDPIECKNKIHNYALKKHIEMDQRSSLFMSPGSGKTRIGVIAAGENIKKYGGKWLVSVPKENLIKQWKDEFIKWKYKTESNNIDFICHASNAKVNINNYDGVIVDESHLCIGSEVHGAIFNYEYKLHNKKLLCLTGTKPDKEKLDLLLCSAPCSFELTLDEAVELKLISEYIINVIEVQLTVKELLEYKKAQHSFVYYKSLLGNFDAFDKATEILKNSKASNFDKKNATMFYGAIRKRKTIAQNAQSKLPIAKELIDLYPDHNIITFGETNISTTALHKSIGARALLFHSGLKDSQKQEALKKFNDKRTKENVMCSTRALSEGFNVPQINMAIVTAFTSKANTLIQRLSRSTRYIEGKQAKIFILCVPDSQEQTWLKTALKSVSHVRYFESIEAYKNLL